MKRVTDKMRNGYMAGWSPAVDDMALMDRWAMVGGLLASHERYGAGGAAPSSKKPEFKHYKFIRHSSRIMTQLTGRPIITVLTGTF